MTPKEKLAHDIIELVAKQSPYKANHELHERYVLGRLAGELSNLLYTDSRLLANFIRRLKK